MRKRVWKTMEKIRDLIWSITNNSDNYDKKYMKIKIDSDDDLPLKKTLEVRNMVINVWSVFHVDNKYTSKVVFINHKC